MNRPKVVFFAELFSLSGEAVGVIESAGAQLVQCHSRDAALVADLSQDALAVMTALVPIQAEAIRNMRKCRVISNLGVGFDHIDIDTARSHGVTVTHVPDYCTDEVADHTLALALSLARDLPALQRAVLSGKWIPELTAPMRPLKEMTFGVLGFGRIGKTVIERAQAFKFKLAACDPYVPDEVFAASGIGNLSLEELLTQSDILSLHVPLTGETRHIMNAESFRSMKPSAMLVNTARGAVVDTLALADALERRIIASAAIDVFEEEPLPGDHPIRCCDRTILTPHWAWHSSVSMLKLQRLAAEEAIRAINGESPRCPVN